MDDFKRTMLEWPWYDAPKMRMLFLHLLMVAETKERVWRDRTLRRGDVIVNYDILSTESGIPKKDLGTVINDLVEAEEIGICTVGDFVIISINNYDDFFPKEETMAVSGLKRIEG